MTELLRFDAKVQDSQTPLPNANVPSNAQMTPLHAFATSACLQFGAIVRRFSVFAFLIGHDGEKLHGLWVQDATALNGSELAAAAML